MRGNSAAGNKSSLVKMSSTPEPPAFKKEPLKEKDFGNPGLGGIRMTTVCRAKNPELFIKPNKPVMAFGLTTFSLYVAYTGYLHATQRIKRPSMKLWTVKSTVTRKGNHLKGINIVGYYGWSYMKDSEITK